MAGREREEAIGAEPRKRVVLIVDDDEALREVTRKLLETQFGGVVEEASNAAQGVILADKLQPDFVILDYLMPSVDGAMAVTTIRDVAPHSTIVAFSAVLEGEPEWADAYLPKLDIAGLPDLLKELSAHRP